LVPKELLEVLDRVFNARFWKKIKKREKLKQNVKKT